MKGPQVEGLTKENLVKLYVEDENASMASVAEILGCHRETVRRWLNRYDLPIKSRSRKGPRKPENEKLGDAEWLATEMEKKSFKQIARELGTTVHDVWYWTEKHGLRDIDMSKSEAVKEGLEKAFPEGRFGSDAANWQGGRRKQHGYIYIYAPDHPNATKAGYVMEHRLIMEDEIGRYLEDAEVVHHLNGIKDDNRVENLRVEKRGKHVSNHFKASHEVLSQRAEIKRLRKRIAELEAKLEQCKGNG